MFQGQNKMKRYDVIIIGAGAAGLFCAAQIGKFCRFSVGIEDNIASVV